MGKLTISPAVRFASFFSGADDEGTEELSFELPADLTTLSDTEVSDLHVQAAEHFKGLYGDGTGIDAAKLETLNTLTEAIQALASEKAVRAENAATMAAEAAELASTVTGTLEVTGDLDIADGEEAAAEETVVEVPSAEDASMATKRTIKLPARSAKAVQDAAKQAMANEERKDVSSVLSVVGEGMGMTGGADFSGLGKALDNRLKSFNLTQYQNANNLGRPLREVGSFAAIQREFAPELVVNSNDREHVTEVIKAATAASQLASPAMNSLLASGGWHAASEVLYDEFLQLEASAGGLSTPEITLTRGGTQWTPGVSFAEIFAAVGFAYTEDEDIAGTYDDDSGVLVEGPKPSYHIEIPEFEELRLGIYGLIIEAGLLAARGYPEYMADIIRKALVAHFHKMNAAKIADIAAGSTAVTFPTQAGATAGLLGAMEIQAEHYRDTHRMDPNSVLEVGIPSWIKGTLRHDLSRRLGVDLISVPDARLAGWFAERNLAVQLVQDYQSISTTPVADFTAWPSQVQFLMYAAGTWVTAKSDVITLDTLYDSVNLKNNDFTALFTEEGQGVLKVGTDSRKITVPFAGSGVTHIGDEILFTGATV